MRRWVVLAALALGCGGDDTPDRAPSERALTAGTVATAPVTAPPESAELQIPEGPVDDHGGRVLRRVQLRSRPGGRALRTLGRRTDLGGPQILAIVARRGGWYGVLHPTLPNGRAGWIPVDAVELLREPWHIVIDRSDRHLRVFRDDELVDDFLVAVGRPGSPTPTGRFAVTDRLTPAAGSPYGCCILAISGRQTNLPPGWTGGDRLALHGTTSGLVGGAYSSGCVRIQEADLRRLMRRIPVGTRVTVRP